MVLLGFDLLELDGADLRQQPREQRKVALGNLLRHSDAAFSLSSTLRPSGEIVFEHACQLGLEVIVSEAESGR